MRGRESFLHKITAPNRLVRLSKSGHISYSQRLTISSECRRDLRKFPMDNQKCQIEIGSFGYSLSEIQYKWTENPIEVDEFALADYILMNYVVTSRNMSSKNVTSVKFLF